MYGRFRVLSGDISLMYGSPKGEKPEKCTPEVGFSHDGLPYISEKAHGKAPILPYIRYRYEKGSPIGSANGDPERNWLKSAGVLQACCDTRHGAQDQVGVTAVCRR